ncbi:MAG: hypothetical protein FJ267_10185 [Planctomycetes bacterium]|nr:hypothetical protein [Planctomycetota bacterium]
MFHSFVSTGDPNTGTAWQEDTTFPPPVPPTATFDPTGYESDPLSRFDLYFRGNVYDAGSIDTVGADLVDSTLTNGFLGRNPALVAFYNNSDGVFKSRLNTIAAPDLPGPFDNAERARNATRQASRLPGYNAPVGVGLVGNTFLYPGMGQSTWRANTADPSFVFDAVPFVDTGNPITGTTGSANPFGNFLSDIGNNGEQPYSWGTLP